MSRWVFTLPVCKNRLWLASLSGCMHLSVLVDLAVVGGLKEVTPCVKIYFRLQRWS